MRKSGTQSDAKQNDGILFLLLNNIVEFDSSSLHVLNIQFIKKDFKNLEKYNKFHEIF